MHCCDDARCAVMESSSSNVRQRRCNAPIRPSNYLLAGILLTVARGTEGQRSKGNKDAVSSLCGGEEKLCNETDGRDEIGSITFCETNGSRHVIYTTTCTCSDIHYVEATSDEVDCCTCRCRCRCQRPLQVIGGKKEKAAFNLAIFSAGTFVKKRIKKKKKKETILVPGCQDEKKKRVTSLDFFSSPLGLFLQQPPPPVCIAHYLTQDWGLTVFFFFFFFLVIIVFFIVAFFLIYFN